jgi:hypothetical protein
VRIVIAQRRQRRGELRGLRAIAKGRHSLLNIGVQGQSIAAGDDQVARPLTLAGMIDARIKVRCEKQRVASATLLRAARALRRLRAVRPELSCRFVGEFEETRSEGG